LHDYNEFITLSLHYSTTNDIMYAQKVSVSIRIISVPVLRLISQQATVFNASYLIYPLKMSYQASFPLKLFKSHQIQIRTELSKV